MFPGPPAPDADFDEVIERAQRSSADPTKILPRAPDVRVELGHHRREAPARPSRLPPQLVSDASQRLFINVEKQPVALPPVRVPEKGKRLAPRIEDARLLRMQRQTETAQHVLQPGQFSVWTTRRQEDEIVRIADESSSQIT